MYPHTHFLFPLFIALVLQKLGFISWRLALLAGFVGIFVDIDHYIEHILHAQTKKFSLVDTWNNSVKLHKFYQRSFIHHWQGFLLISLLFLVGFFWNRQFILALALGYYSHLLLDHLHLNHKHLLGAKIKGFYLEEPWGEIMLDLLLIVGICLISFTPV